MAVIAGCTPGSPNAPFTMLPPACAVKDAALDMVPRFVMFWTAFKIRLRFKTGLTIPGKPPAGITVVIVAPLLLKMFCAEIVAVLTSGFVEIA